MPLPVPSEGESEDDFISRCMANETANTDFPQQVQRSAVCFRQWREAKGTEMSTGTNEIHVDDNSDKALSLERLQARIYDAFDTQFPTSQAQQVATLSNWHITEMFDEYVIISADGVHWKIAYTEDDETVIFAPREEWQKVKEKREWIDAKNALKAISRTPDELRVGNYIVLFGGRDLEGVGSPRINPDGTLGEYFTPDTVLESDHTKAGILFVDWEHGRDVEPGHGDILGVVDWKTVRTDERGVWVERVLNRRSKYLQWLEELIDDGKIGTSSEPVQAGVEKAEDGKITCWPLLRDTLTVEPMEPRMMAENHLAVAYKSLGLLSPEYVVNIPGNGTGLRVANDNQPEQPEASPEADTSAVDVARAKARSQQILLSLMED